MIFRRVTVIVSLITRHFDPPAGSEAVWGHFVP